MGLEAEIIIDNLNEFNNQIRDEFIKKGINDTGNASKSIRTVQLSENKYASVGNDYIEILNRGRGPGKYAPVANIREWVKRKLDIKESDLWITVKRVNQKLKDEGSGIYKDNSKGLEIDAKIEVLRENLTKDLSVFAKADILKQLDKFQKRWEL